MELPRAADAGRSAGDRGAHAARASPPNHPFVHSRWPREQALAYFRERDQPYKVEIIENLPDAEVGIYQQGPFLDLCRGPHVESTGQIGAVKLHARGGGLLARRRAPPDAAAALWHGLVHAGRAGRLPGAAGRGQRAATIAGWARSLSCSWSATRSAPGCRSGCPKGPRCAACSRTTSWASSARRAISTSTRRSWRSWTSTRRPGIGSTTTTRCIRRWRWRAAKSWCCAR